MENTARALAATPSQRSEVTALIKKSVPILQKHIDKALSLRKTTAKTQTAARPDSLRREKARSDSLKRQAKRDAAKRATPKP
jgi:hypothetical protein